MRAPASAPVLGVDARILELAAQDIRRHGAERATVVAIARAAGMSHANVYRYFPSKEALIDAVTGEWLKPVEAGLRVIAEAPDPASDKLERVLMAAHRAYREKCDEDRPIFDLLADAAARGGATARRHRGRLHEAVRRAIEEGIANGEFRLGDPRRALAFAIDASFRFVHPYAIRLDAETPRRELDRRFDTILNVIQRALAGGFPSADR